MHAFVNDRKLVICSLHGASDLIYVFTNDFYPESKPPNFHLLRFETTNYCALIFCTLYRSVFHLANQNNESVVKICRKN